jgi:hypothetical protein
MLEAEPMERDRWAGDDLLALDSAVAPIAEVGEYAFVHDVEGLHAQVVLAPGRPSTPLNGWEALVIAIASTGAAPPGSRCNRCQHCSAN